MFLIKVCTSTDCQSQKTILGKSSFRKETSLAWRLSLLPFLSSFPLTLVQNLSGDKPLLFWFLFFPWWQFFLFNFNFSLCFVSGGCIVVSFTVCEPENSSFSIAKEEG